MTAKITNLTKKIEQKKRALANEIDARDKKIASVEKMEKDLKILEAELVTAHLVAHGMTVDDLADLLGPTDEEVGHVSGN